MTSSAGSSWWSKWDLNPKLYFSIRKKKLFPCVWIVIEIEIEEGLFWLYNKFFRLMEMHFKFVKNCNSMNNRCMVEGVDFSCVQIRFYRIVFNGYSWSCELYIYNQPTSGKTTILCFLFIFGFVTICNLGFVFMPKNLIYNEILLALKYKLSDFHRILMVWPIFFR